MRKNLFKIMCRHDNYQKVILEYIIPAAKKLKAGDPTNKLWIAKLK